MLCFSNKVCNTSLHQPILDEMKQKNTILRKNGNLCLHSIPASTDHSNFHTSSSTLFVSLTTNLLYNL